MEKIRTIFHSHSLLVLSLTYLIFRMIFLTKLPIFNDEAIYLDWGWKELHSPGALFYSLIDGKQPFLMWIFGISQILFSDQLFAGRIISVGGGFLAMIGLYKIGEKFFSKRVGILASLFYVIIPLFSTFDRLSLMESSITACGVWALYYLLLLLQDNKRKYAVYAGIILGIGFFIKSSALIFLVTSFSLLLFAALSKVISKEKTFIYFLPILISFTGITLLLLLQPMFWQTLSMNSRYSLTLSEIVAFPLFHFFKNMMRNVEILFVFVSPLVALLGLIGGARLLKKGDLIKYLVLWFLISLFLQMLFVRGTTQRYVVSFLPLICVLAANELETWRKKLRKAYALLIGAVVLIPLFLTYLQLTNPVGYVRFTTPLSNLTEGGLVYGQVSGYGVREIVEKIEAYSSGRPIVVATAINIGNPESAMRAYFHKSSTVKVGFLDRKMFGPELFGYDCIDSLTPLLYVSRDYQQSEMNDYLREVDRVRHPFTNYSLGLYTLKECNGKSIEFDPYLLTQ